MKMIIKAGLAVLAMGGAWQTMAEAKDPVSPLPGAVCNLYAIDYWDGLKGWKETAATLAQQPAVATFADTASEFFACKKQEDVLSDFGMWTGWLKLEQAGTYTFVCNQAVNEDNCFYGIWINGKKCLDEGIGQTAFNVELEAGFNTVTILDSAWPEEYPLTITYKKAGSLKEPETFGPGDMFHDDEED